MHLLKWTFSNGPARKISIELEQYSQESKYAILSHRWGKAEDEVTFQDMLSGSKAIKTKAGYAKLEGCCRQAHLNGHKRVWIDTCCIDKSSSAELSEAITSMYSYYENAQVCYAFLDDIVKRTERSVKGGSGRGNSFLVSESAWLERGWTLQELVAPETVKFFDSSWSFLGEKKQPDISKDIEEHSGIHSSILRQPNIIRAVSVSCRMSWASQRKTTRIEDRAYSLMGIFGVYMSPIYGEGHNAFIRLQEEIMRTSNDHTLFAWTLPPPKEIPQRYTFENVSTMLALSPSQFKYSSGFLQRPYKSVFNQFDVDRYRHDYTTTNAGLSINLPIVQIDEKQQLYAAILACTEGESLVPSAILLHTTTDTPRGYFWRANTDSGPIERTEKLWFQENGRDALTMTKVYILPKLTSVSRDHIEPRWELPNYHSPTKYEEPEGMASLARDTAIPVKDQEPAGMASLVKNLVIWVKEHEPTGVVSLGLPILHWSLPSLLRGLPFPELAVYSDASASDRPSETKLVDTTCSNLVAPDTTGVSTSTLKTKISLIQAEDPCLRELENLSRARGIIYGQQALFYREQAKGRRMFPEDFPWHPDSPIFGRAAELRSIRKHFKTLHGQIESPEVVVISGVEKIGKTEVAREFGRVCRDEDLFSSVTWIDATTPESMNQGFHKVAKEFGLDYPGRAPLSDVVLGVLKWLDELGRYLLYPGRGSHSGRWLLIFDGVPNFDQLQDFWSSIAGAGTGSVLVTSRNSVFGRELRSETVVLGSFSESLDLSESLDSQIRTLQPPAFALLSVISFFDARYIHCPILIPSRPLTWDKYPVDESDVRANLDRLMELSLITRSGQGDSVRMLRLVQNQVQARLKSGPYKKAMATATTLIYYAWNNIGSEADELEWISDNLLPHLLRLQMLHGKLPKSKELSPFERRLVWLAVRSKVMKLVAPVAVDVTLTTDDGK